ncbi:hypothetical protein, partial [uncultured Desulfovibrio sp.]|uniref:hypothetical protein n=1 Tax=uncultured Desulfovibrio sp. TaxID=167968 RepID=UPI002630BC24
HRRPPAARHDYGNRRASFLLGGGGEWPCRSLPLDLSVTFGKGGNGTFSDNTQGRFAFFKGKTRGGGTAPPGPNGAEKPRFFRETTGRMV